MDSLFDVHTVKELLEYWTVVCIFTEKAFSLSIIPSLYIIYNIQLGLISYTWKIFLTHEKYFLHMKMVNLKTNKI